MDKSEQDPKDLYISELLQQLRDREIDKDNWRIQALVNDAKLKRILRSPAWKLTKPFRVLNLVAWRIKPNLLNDSTCEWQSQPSGQTVYQDIKELISIEVNNANLNASKIAVIAQWSKEEILSLSTNALISQLIENGFEVLLVSACESPEPLVLADELLRRITIIRKPNIGYDFGSWSIGLLTFSEICQADEVLMLNDSNSGPFGSLTNLLDKMNESPFDITGVTDSIQHRYHIQSFIMHFKNNSLNHKSMVTFWKDIRSRSSKLDLVLAYEIGLTSRAQGNGLLVGAVYPWNVLVDYRVNASITAWERLLDLGYPFIKREVVRSLTTKQISTLLETRFRNSSRAESIKTMLAQDSEIK